MTQGQNGSLSTRLGGFPDVTPQDVASLRGPLVLDPLTSFRPGPGAWALTTLLDKNHQNDFSYF